MEPPVLPLAGVRISLELLDNTRWSSRRLTSQLSAMECVKTSLEQPDWDKSSSSMTLSSVLEVLLAKTHVKVMVVAPLSAHPNMTLTPISKLVLLPGVLDVVKMEHQEFMLM